MSRLLEWLRRRQVRRVTVTTAPADVLLQSVAVLRHFGARVVRCDVEDGTLEARLAAGARLTLAAVEDAAGSRASIVPPSTSQRTTRAPKCRSTATLCSSTSAGAVVTVTRRT